MTAIRAWLLDCNGVVFVDDDLLPGVAETIDHVRSNDVSVRFVTNHPRRSRRGTATHLTNLGVSADETEVITSTWATARYLDDHEYRSVFVIGSDGLRAELDAAEIEETTTNPDAVVVRVTPEVTYESLTVATRLLLDRDTAFIATNPDATYPTPVGPSPGTGALVAFLERASGRTATVVGKPAAPMFEYALSTLHNVDPSEVVFVGDTIATDIVGAHRAHIRAAFVGSPPPTRSGHRTRSQIRYLTS